MDKQAKERMESLLSIGFEQLIENEVINFLEEGFHPIEIQKFMTQLVRNAIEKEEKF